MDAGRPESAARAAHRSIAAHNSPGDSTGAAVRTRHPHIQLHVPAVSRSVRPARSTSPVSRRAATAAMSAASIIAIRASPTAALTIPLRRADSNWNARFCMKNSGCRNTNGRPDARMSASVCACNAPLGTRDPGAVPKPLTLTMSTSRHSASICATRAPSSSACRSDTGTTSSTASTPSSAACQRFGPREIAAVQFDQTRQQRRSAHFIAHQRTHGRAAPNEFARREPTDTPGGTHQQNSARTGCHRHSLLDASQSMQRTMQSTARLLQSRGPPAVPGL